MGTFALPALFLLNAASMELGAFDIRVLLAILLARYLMVAVACGMTQMMHPNAANLKGTAAYPAE